MLRFTGESAPSRSRFGDLFQPTTPDNSRGRRVLDHDTDAKIGRIYGTHNDFWGYWTPVGSYVLALVRSIILATITT